MVEALRIRPLLHGYRGRRAADLNSLVEVLMRVSYLISENEAIVELDVNPLLVTSDSVMALDARMLLDGATLNTKQGAYSHLAIRPYPDEYIRSATLKNETQIVLRPIRPEDEAEWHAFMKSCSQHSIWQRFRYLFKETTHEMAARFCFVDYDRTMAIVAEIELGEARRIIGVARLVADADHSDAEYAVLVADEWQGQGLGALLTDFCVEICKSWQVARISVETAADNHRMKKILQRHNFKEIKSSDGIVLYQAQVSPGRKP
jgi:acetyltransferase